MRVLIHGLLVALLGVGCGGSGGAPRLRVESELAQWATGPVRWLLLPDDWREVQAADDPGGALGFTERFWSERDPTPGEPGNLFRQTFEERIEAADLLYGEPGQRGALTDRGRVLLLFGPPEHLRLTSESALAWKPGRRGRPVASTRRVPVETWIYPVESLPDGLPELLRDAGFEGPVEFRFRTERQRTTMVAGKPYLDLAAQAAVRNRSPG